MNFVQKACDRVYHRRIICLLLAAVMLASPLLSAYALSLSTLSDKELLALFSSMQKEIERRGLSVESINSSQAPSKSVSIIPEPQVWVPKSGQKYHSKPTCSNMKNPRQVDLSVAKACGFEACKKCKPPK